MINFWISITTRKFTFLIQKACRKMLYITRGVRPFCPILQVMVDISTALRQWTSTVIYQIRKDCIARLTLAV